MARQGAYVFRHLQSVLKQWAFKQQEQMATHQLRANKRVDFLPTPGSLLKVPRVVRSLALMLLTALLIVAPDITQPISTDATSSNQVMAQEVASVNIEDSQTLLQKGREFYQAGQWNEAIQRWQQAATIAETQGDRLTQAMALSNLALAYQQIGAWTEANQALASSLQVLNGPHATPSSSKAQRSVLAQVLNAQGKLHFASGNFEQALDHWQQASAYYEASGDREGVVLSQLNQAQALKSLGLYRRAAALLEPLYQTYNRQPESLQFALLLNYGDTLRLLGRVENGSPNAQTILQQALDQARQRQSSPDIASALLNLGNTTRALQSIQATRYTDQPDELKYLYQESLQYYQQTLETMDPAIAAIQSLLNQQSLLVKNTPIPPGQLTQAQDLSRQIQAALSQVTPGHSTVYAYLQLAENLFRLKRESVSVTALELLDQAASQAASIGDFQMQAYALWRKFYQQTLQYYQQAATATDTPSNKVQALLNQQSLLLGGNQITEAEKADAQALSSHIQTALDRLPLSHATLYAHIHFAQNLIKLGSKPTNDMAIQELNWVANQAERLKDVQAQSYAFGNLGSLYEQNQQWQSAQALSQQALFLAQTTQAANLAYRWQWQLGRLLKAQKDIPGAISAYKQAVASLNSLRKDLATINTDNADLQFSFRLNAEPVYLELVDLLLQSADSNGQNLETARSVIESLQVAELENFFQEACAPLQVEIEGVDSTAAILYPIVLKDRLEIIVSLYDATTPRHIRLRHYAIPVTAQEIERTSNLFRQSLIPSAPSQERLILGQKLYDWLIRPAQADFAQANVQTLVFIMNGSLRNIPMAALHDGTQFLVQNYNIALTPGLQLIELQPFERKTLNALIAGLTASTQGFPALPSVQTEVKEIKQTIASKLILNEKLTNKNLKQELSNVSFNAIHLATHGQFSSNADQTFILTWDERMNVKELDALLRTTNQNDLSPLELLVLSACQTASGDKRAALGLAGIAVRSGARSTVASLWPVNDDATADFMTSFYQALNEPGTSKAQALRMAQIDVLSKYPSPYYWAPFVLVGNWL